MSEGATLNFWQVCCLHHSLTRWGNADSELLYWLHALKSVTVTGGKGNRNGSSNGMHKLLRPNHGFPLLMCSSVTTVVQVDDPQQLGSADVDVQAAQSHGTRQLSSPRRHYIDWPHDHMLGRQGRLCLITHTLHCSQVSHVCFNQFSDLLGYPTYEIPFILQWQCLYITTVREDWRRVVRLRKMHNRSDVRICFNKPPAPDTQETG